MYCHVYHEGIGKKGGMNVALLIVKTLQDTSILKQSNPGGELNIIFDNCSGQNKNNTVLKLALWLKEMGCFNESKLCISDCGTHDECLRSPLQFA
jgi:hypothetical protein